MSAPAGTDAFEAYGARIGVRAADPAVSRRLPDYFPPGARRAPAEALDATFAVISAAPPGAPSGREHCLVSGRRRLARAADREAILAALESWLHRAVALHARPWLFVHAGVVGWQGQAIVLPGPSRCGKSTLVAALVRAGARYYSDEYAAFGPDGRVLPYPKRLTLRGWDQQRPEAIAAETLGGAVGEGPLRVGVVVVARYAPGATWDPRPLSPGTGVLALVQNTVAARRRPGETLAVLGKVVAGATLLEGRRGDAGEAVDRLLGAIPALAG